MLDDREFYNDSEVFKIDYNTVDISSKNFSIKQVKQIAKFLNNFVYKLIILENHQEFKKAKKPTVKLLKELFNRDQRKKFCEDNFWVIEEANINYFNDAYF